MIALIKDLKFMKRIIIKSIEGNGKLLDISETKKSKIGHFLLKSGESTPLHITKNREEVILILKGKATIIANNQKYQVKERYFIYLSQEIPHSVENKEDRDLEYVYFVSMF